MQPAQMYDSAATMYSPDGRIYQVEYAREAVKRGTTAVGIAYDDGAVLLVDKRMSSNLIEPTSVEKLFELDRHIGCASSGLVADARVLVNVARNMAQKNRITYDEPIEVGTLVKSLSDLQQGYTQNGGVRPFGCALLVAGINGDKVRLFETDPSGAVIAYRATAIGVGRAPVMEFLEGSYQRDLDLDSAMGLAFKAIKQVHETSGSGSERGAPDVALVTKADGYRKLSVDEVQEWADRQGDEE